MDIIFLRQVRTKTIIGIYDWERTHHQTLELDLDIAIPNANSCHSDNIVDTIHYGEVVEAIRDSLVVQHFLLLEALAEHVAHLILNDFKAPWVRVSVTKLNILEEVLHVGVTIERKKINT
ncbi:MAG: dihydroneopterin aldolase [Neisseriaceae bacterium]|nr:dihydroneopterin aldolase [Neisseriaceae bacterium]